MTSRTLLRLLVCALVAAFCQPASLFAQSITKTTPFSFAQQQNVQQAVQVSQAQSSQISDLESTCDALCQARVTQIIQSFDPQRSSEFSRMPVSDQLGVTQMIADDVRETTELELLGEQVFDSPQMSLFQQLWNRSAGPEAFMQGPLSRELGVSGSQSNQIQQLLDAGGQAISACASNPRLSSQQINVQIQNIQINIMRKCAEMLTPEQRARYREMCGIEDEDSQDDPNGVPPNDDSGDQDQLDQLDGQGNQNDGQGSGGDATDFAQSSGNSVPPRSNQFGQAGRPAQGSLAPQPRQNQSSSAQQQSGQQTNRERQ